MFENRVLRRIFRPNRDEVTGNMGKLQNPNNHLHNLHTSLNTVRIK
jgi:hypothetical protein